MKLAPFVAAALLCSSVASAKDLIEVRVGAMDALSKSDSVTSERFKRGYEAAFFYAFGKYDQKLQKCGYRMSVDFDHFEQEDAAGVQRSAKNLEERGSWIVFAPSRSNHFLLAAKSVTNTPLVSSLANANEVYEQQGPAFTMYPTSSALAQGLLSSIKGKGWGKTYGVAVDRACLVCRDFAASFETAAAGKLKKVFEVDVPGEPPQMDDLIKHLSEQLPEILLLPNYSKNSGYIISALKERFPNLRFLGGDGWGTDEFGFLLRYPIGKEQVGLTARGSLASSKMRQMLKMQSLDSYWSGEALPPSNQSYLISEFVEKITDQLCKTRPTNREVFVSNVRKLPKDFFRTNAGVGVFALKDGTLKFSHRVEGKAL